MFEDYIKMVDEMDKKVRRLQLFLCFDRGMIWSKKKQHFKTTSKTGWGHHLMSNNIWPQTIQKYINFYEMVLKFPRVLISTAQWSDWVTFMTLFIHELEFDDGLRSKAALSLRMNINLSGEVDECAESIPDPSEEDDEFADVMAELENLSASSQ